MVPPGPPVSDNPGYSTCGCLRFSQVATSHHQRGKWRKPHFRVVNVIPINSIVCRQCPEVGLSKGKQSNSHNRHSYGKKGRNIWAIGSVVRYWNYCFDSFFHGFDFWSIGGSTMKQNVEYSNRIWKCQSLLILSCQYLSIIKEDHKKIELFRGSNEYRKSYWSIWTLFDGICDHLHFLLMSIRV